MFSCIQNGTLPRGWSSELPFKRWHHQISALVVLLLNSPLNKFLNSQRRVSVFFFSRTQSSRLTPRITLLQAVDFHWHYNWSPTFILSSSKRCLLTTQADLSPPGLTSSLPPSLQPAPDLAQLVQKKSSLVFTSLLMTTWLHGFWCWRKREGWKSMTGMKRESETLPFGSILPFYQLELLTKYHLRDRSHWLLFANSTFHKVIQTRSEYEWRCKQQVHFSKPQNKQKNCLVFFTLQTKIQKGSSFMQLIHPCC